jgi:hypothetical protein
MGITAGADHQYDPRSHRSIRPVAFLGFAGLLALSTRTWAEDLEPRRWTHLPIGLHSLSLGYAYTEADIHFDPGLRLENVQMDLHAAVLKYLQTFALFERTARVELTQGYAFGHWSGTVDGAYRTTDREGLLDTQVRFAVNLFGAPALAGKEYQAYRAQPGMETIVGAGVVVHLPTGQYDPDKLINLGTNRYTVRPQLGVLHNWDDWSFEYTGSVWWSSKNDDFYNDSTLEQTPLYSVQGHVVRTFAPGVWVGASGAYTYGNETILNGKDLDDPREHVIWSLGVGFPITRQLLVKVAYIGQYAYREVGVDFESVVIGAGYQW